MPLPVEGLGRLGVSCSLPFRGGLGWGLEVWRGLWVGLGGLAWGCKLATLYTLATVTTKISYCTYCFDIQVV